MSKHDHSIPERYRRPPNYTPYISNPCWWTVSQSIGEIDNSTLLLTVYDVQYIFDRIHDEVGIVLDWDTYHTYHTDDTIYLIMDRGDDHMTGAAMCSEAFGKLFTVSHCLVTKL